MKKRASMVETARKACTVLFASIMALLLMSCKKAVEPTATVAVTGVHHLGPEYLVPTYLLTAANVAGTVGDEGAGGDICCVLVPLSWRPGISLEIRWEVHDQRSENKAETARGEFKSLSPKIYKAHVEIEQYSQPGTVYVHFFKDGYVRVVSSVHDLLSKEHPIPWGKHDVADPKAAKGVEISELFTEEERTKAIKEQEDDWH